MITRLPSDPLHTHAHHIFLTSTMSTSLSNSWFMQIRKILLQYQLPPPLVLLSNPPTKEAFKKLVKAKVIDYWESKLRSEAAFLPSLKFLRPQYMSLTSPHKLLTTAGSKPYEVAKACIQLRFLSSQYSCGQKSRHWSIENPGGWCTFPDCYTYQRTETPEHILLHCPAYEEKRTDMVALCMKISNAITHSLVTKFLGIQP